MSALIGVTPDTHDGDKLAVRVKTEKIVYLWDSYLKAIIDHGAIPVVLPVIAGPARVNALMEKLDGLLVAGGNFDVPPEYYGEEPRPWLGRLKPDRSRFELMALKNALRRDLPVLGICGGLQIINVALGGSLYQDILKEREGSMDHQQKIGKDRPSHALDLMPGSMLARIVRQAGAVKGQIKVNSSHHQCVKKLGRGLAVGAAAKDGVIEAVESERHSFVLGVQWHPELLYPRRKDQAAVFRAFIAAASRFRP